MQDIFLKYFILLPLLLSPNDRILMTFILIRTRIVVPQYPSSTTRNKGCDGWIPAKVKTGSW